MRRTIIALLSLASFILLAAGSPAFAQTGNPATGFPPFSTQSRAQWDTINLSNLNVHLGIPVTARKGRGPDFRFLLSYDSTVYTKLGLSTTSWFLNFGWQGTNGPSLGGGTVLSSSQPVTCSGGGSGTKDTYSAYADSFQTLHPFTNNITANTCDGTGGTTTTNDGSGYTITIGGVTEQVTIASRDGTVETLASASPTNPSVTITDSNGNQITSNATGVTDTLGTKPVTISGANSWPNPISYQFPNPQGGTSTITFSYANPAPAVQSAFQCPGVTEVSIPAGQEPLVDTITLPDGSTYHFTYEQTPGNPSAVTGRLASVKLPTGGSISYQYTGPNSGINCTDGTTMNLTRTTPDGTWTYARSIGSGAASTTTITDPQGNQTVIQFQGIYETQRQVFQGSSTSGTLVQTVVTCYNGNNTNCNTTSVALPIARETVFLQPPNGKQSKQDVFFDSTSGLPTELDEYDFGSNSPGPLLRKTVTTYASLGNNILNRPASVIVYDGNGNQKVKTTYGYDETTPTATSGVPHHVAVSGSRGNPTSINRWLDTTNSNLTSTLSYDDTGNVLTATDPLGRATRYTYSSNFANAYVTQVNLPDTSSVHHIISGNYDINTGLLTSFTDQNGKNYSYQYDSTLRPTQSNNPDGGQTTWTYNSLTNVAASTKLTSTQNLAGTTLLDSFGRTSQTQLTSDPQGTLFADTAYDSLGRPATASTPYRSKTEPTYGIGTVQYDALGRTIKLIPPDGTTSSNNVTTDYSNFPAVTVTDQAGKQRRAVSDGLARLIEVDEPGDSFAGTQSAGSLTISGSEQSKSGVGATPATPGTGTVAIGGPGSQSVCCDGNGSLIWDSGNVYITVNGFTDQVGYAGGSPCCINFIAQYLVNTINQDNPYVTASCQGGVCSNTNPMNIILTAKTSGSNTNYSLSAGSTYDSVDFSQPSFTATASGAALTGGTDGNPGTTVYDSGTVTVTIGSFTASASYGQTGNNTLASVASALASALNVSSSPVTASASGSTVTMTYKTVGTAGNVAVACTSSTSQGNYFSSPSFTCSSTTLSGGQNPEGPSLDHNFFVTQYTYDALNNLLSVTQEGDPSVTNSSQWRVRTFACDSLSRLKTATNPESGTITYAYDADGNIISKIAPAPNQTGTATVTTTYSYDALNRLTQKSYSDGTTPTVKYGYDGVAPSGCSPPSLAITNGIGRRTSMCDAAGSEAWSYDTMGRPLADARTTNGSTKAITKTTSYTYNLDGSIKTLTNPSGRVITYTYNTAAHQVSAVDNNGVSYASNALYAPQGALSSLQNGASIVSTLYYNSRLQPCRISVKSTGSTPSACSDTANIGNVLDYGYNFSLGTANNGSVMGIANNRDNTRSQSFSYDALNRLATAATQATSGTNAWGLSFGYDAWGNLLTESVTQGSAPMLNVGVGTNNRVTGFCYDAAGNLLDQGACPSTSHTYVYNAENQLTTTASVTYAYDGDGRRVSKSNGKLYWYGMGNDALDETDLKGSLTFEYVFFGGTRIARRDSSGNVDYYFADHLGTARVVTNASGAILDDSDFYPFGGERAIVSSSGNTYKFTGDERDSESSSDHTLFRQYSFPLGRWITPDPAGLAAADATNPQSWNPYAYVLNNPLNAIDYFGLDCVYLSSNGDPEIVSGDCRNEGDAGIFFDGTIAYITVIGPNDDFVGGVLTNGDSFCAGSCDAHDTVTVSADKGSWLEFLTASSVPRYVENDVSLNVNQQKTLGQVYNNTRLIADASDVAACTAVGLVVGDGGVPPSVTHAGSELAADALNNPKTATAAARAYYTATDARFTAGGEFSKVLVPRAAAALRPALTLAGEVVSVAGWALLAYEANEMRKKCASRVH